MLGKDDETVKGVTAAEEQDPNEKEVLTDRARSEETDESQDAPKEPKQAPRSRKNKAAKDVEVTYNGIRASYADPKLGRFNRGETVTVSQEDAERLLAQPGFVRASN